MPRLDRGRSRGPRSRTTRDDDGDLVETEAKAKPEDYKDRKGYVATFLGDEFAVDLPTIVKGKSDILTWGNGKEVLPYEHFSVVMNAKRRQCFFSACNIDGARSKSSKRTPWRFDPRIPQDMQIMKECYGNTPKFSRGHMTRREDPAWGKSASVIQRGANDSMHVTNVTPQMQSFNAPIWLALEDYALQHAREDDQKISVFTGPYFTKNDPTMFGVRIPVKFWKVIAFVHDETGELCATGYEMSQEDNLEPPEFVFGDFVSPQLNISTQVPISTIETRAGISFNGLADVDPLANEGIGDATTPAVVPGADQVHLMVAFLESFPFPFNTPAGQELWRTPGRPRARAARRDGAGREVRRRSARPADQPDAAPVVARDPGEDGGQGHDHRSGQGRARAEPAQPEGAVPEGPDRRQGGRGQSRAGDGIRSDGHGAGGAAVHRRPHDGGRARAEPDRHTGTTARAGAGRVPAPRRQCVRQLHRDGIPDRIGSRADQSSRAVPGEHQGGVGAGRFRVRRRYEGRQPSRGIAASATLAPSLATRQTTGRSSAWRT